MVHGGHTYRYVGRIDEKIKIYMNETEAGRMRNRT